nr:spindle assembly checkpoint component MAD1-like [Tanacetum cinerariifolium]
GTPQDALKDQGYFNSGCSRHMAGNVSYLTDFKEHDGGYVAFGEELKVVRLLVKAQSELDTLVRGLPSKRFENDQTCAACLKGKQRKVSFKSKL